LAVDIIGPVEFTLAWLLWLGALGVEGTALVHAILQRTDAFPAAGKLAKGAWIAILAVLLLLTLLFGPQRVPSLLALIGVAAGLVYLLDVRPAVRDVSGGGSSSW